MPTRVCLSCGFLERRSLVRIQQLAPLARLDMNCVQWSQPEGCDESRLQSTRWKLMEGCDGDHHLLLSRFSVRFANRVGTVEHQRHPSTTCDQPQFGLTFASGLRAVQVNNNGGQHNNFINGGPPTWPIAVAPAVTSRPPTPSLFFACHHSAMVSTLCFASYPVQAI